MERKRSVRRQRRYERPFAKKCKEYCRSFIAFLFSNVGIIGLVLGYTLAGAFMFSTIERDYNLKYKAYLDLSRNLTADLLWNMTLQENNFKPKETRQNITDALLEYQRRIVMVVRRGYDGNLLTYKEQWSFPQAFLYSLTVITTIGYGNIYTHTDMGKIATIFYAILGMPLFLLYLSNIGDVMARSFKWVYANLCLCRWCPGVAKRRAERRLKRVRMREDEDYGSDEESEESIEGYQEDMETRAYYKRNSIVESELTEVTVLTNESYDVQAVTVPISICLMIMVGYICGGALLFCRWQEWEFLDAFYFCFISLSTIGFGDLVPGDKIFGHKNVSLTEVFELSFIFCSMYLMLGMALIAMCFNLMQEEVIHKIRSTIRTFKYILGCNR